MSEGDGTVITTILVLLTGGWASNPGEGGGGGGGEGPRVGLITRIINQDFNFKLVVNLHVTRF